MKYRRLIALLLVMSMLLSMLTISISAASMKASDSLVQFIKNCEGFTKYKQWDYSHWSIGYGTQCDADDYPNGITEDEADALLRRALSKSEGAVDDFVSKNGLQPSQQQYDCMVSITYGLGTEWMLSKYQLPRLLINGCTELELLNSLGSWVSAGGETLNGLIYRRMRETYIYFHGEYNSTGNIAKDVPYACIKFDPAGGTVSTKRLYTFRDQPYGQNQTLPVPTRSGYTFAGWFDSNGNQITDDTVAKTTLTSVTARWKTGVELDWVFNDVNSGHWFYHDVKKAKELKIFEGYTDGSFRPDESITRAMFIQVIYRAAGAPKTDAEEPFTDVNSGTWYYDAVRWAYGRGIVKGVSEDRFAPEQIITREQMATMLFNYCASIGQTDKDQYASIDSFADAKDVSDFAREPMQWVVGVGLIQGVGNNRLAPKQVATRSQGAAIMVRMTALIQKNIA
ncbi:MAG: hypothetical protein E7464_01380 [Ruminococcaceae bacterium]|nr:hypothetical protein [Oscillospiraceae bacterium]